MKINFYNVEHGSCCHIITPNNKHILVDVGSREDCSIVKYIRDKYFYGNDGFVDGLIITHPHEDHIYDLPNLFSCLKPSQLLHPRDAFDISFEKKTPLNIAIERVANEMNQLYTEPTLPDACFTNIQVNGGVNFKIISPKKEWTLKNDLNTFSNIIVLEYCGKKFVLMGDNPASILQKMIDINHENIREVVKDATVLLAPHHGRSGEFCKSFFEYVNPILTVVSDKSIVHGTQEDTANLYKGRGMIINGEKRYLLSTRNDGTISFEIDAHSFFVAMNKENY